MKTAVAAVCVVAAGMGGFKAYNAANQSQADLLLAENVEALSGEDTDIYGSIIPNAKLTKRDCQAVEVRSYQNYTEVVKHNGKERVCVSNSPNNNCNVNETYPCIAFMIY